MAGILKGIVGHQAQIQRLLESLRGNALPNGFIFNGPDGIGKKLIVRGLLQERLCQRDQKACGHCSHCQRVFEEKNEFIYEISAKEKKTIGVEPIRALLPFLSLQTMSSVRFIIVDAAEKLTPQGANALLKVLEEPPEKTHFFLITEKYSSLLPTIRSRCQIMNFRPLSVGEMSTIPDVSPEVLGWAGGRPAMAQFLSESENLEHINQAYALLYQLLQKKPVDWKKQFPAFFLDLGVQNLYYELWQSCLLKKLRGETSQDLDFLPAEGSALLAFYEGIQLAISDWSRNVDKILVIENLYYHFQNSLKAPEETLWNSPVNY